MDDLHIEPIASVQVDALACVCGSCGQSFVIGYEALDQDEGKVDPEHDFGECEHCGVLFDAQSARFMASMAKR